MKPHTFKKVVVLVILGLIFPQPLLVASDSIQTFNPNFILSDKEMQNYQCMNRSDIQAFLNEKNSFLKNFKTEDINGTKRLAADIIYQASKEHKINPKYLLVKLQKEQSLITDPDPTQKQLNGATGYGITDGCGWDCETYKKNKGFGKQVDSAAGIIRWYYDNIFKETWIKVAGQSYTIDGTKIKPASNATAFLYTYTPHLHGNENFWKLWQKWFEQVYPNGTLVKTADNSAVYVIQNGIKRKFASMTSLVTRFDPKMIIIVPQSELSRYETGSEISLPNYSILKNGSKYYLLDYETLRPFASYETVKKLGYHPDEIIEVNSSDLQGYKTGKTIDLATQNPLGKVAKVKETGSMYLIKDGQYSPVLDERIVGVNFSDLDIETIKVEELADYTRGKDVVLKDGTIFGIEGSNKIYVAEDGKKRHIASEEVFNGLGYNWGNIVWINQFAGMAHKNGQPIYLRADINIEDTQETTTKAIAGEKIANTNSDAEDVMIRTPENEISFIGPKFSTEVDGYLVADYETNEILAGKNIDTIRPMASLTKVMTAYVLFDQNINLEVAITYEPSKHKAQYHYIKISPGESVKNKDLLKDMLVRSYNTPAYMLVSAVNKYVDDFVEDMNKQAKQWELEKTKFVDPYGGGIENKTTVKEYFKLFTNAVKNQEIKTILGTKDYEYNEVLDLDKQPYHYKRHTNNLVRKDGLPFDIVASKTGCIDESGATLAMLVQRKTDSKKFVIITMGNPDSTNRFDEPEKLTNWAINKF